MGLFKIPGVIQIRVGIGNKFSAIGSNICICRIKLNSIFRVDFDIRTIALFAWAAVDPVEFATSMQAIALVPEPMWIVLGSIVVFWFGGKTLQGMKAPTMSPDKVKAVLEGMQATQALKPKPASISELDFQAEMADTKKPLSNAAILEWNRRRQEGWKP